MNSFSSFNFKTLISLFEHFLYPNSLFLDERRGENWDIVTKYAWIVAKLDFSVGKLMNHGKLVMLWFEILPMLVITMLIIFDIMAWLVCLSMNRALLHDLICLIHLHAYLHMSCLYWLCLLSKIGRLFTPSRLCLCP